MPLTANATMTSSLTTDDSPDFIEPKQVAGDDVTGH